MKQVSLADITFNQGLQLLVLRKQGLDSGKIRRMPKEAMDNAYPLQAVGTQMIESVKEAGLVDDFKNSISSAGNSLQEGFDGVKGGVQNWWGQLEEPTKSTFRHGLVGAGLGAASGAGASLLGDGKHYGRNMLMGGVAGGALGGGLGIMRNPGIADKLQEQGEGLFDDLTADPEKEKAKGSKTPAVEYEDSDPKGWAREANRLHELSNESAAGLDEVEAEQQRLHDKTNESPHTWANSKHVATAAGVGYGARKIHNIVGDDPMATANTIGGMKRKDLNSDALQRHLGLKPKDIKGKTLEELADRIRKSPTLGTTLLGNSKNPDGLRSLVNAPKPILPNSPVPGTLSKGFKRHGRWGRKLGLLGLLAAGGTAAVDTEMGRAATTGAQERAHGILQGLQSLIFKDKK